MEGFPRSIMPHVTRVPSLQTPDTESRCPRLILSHASVLSTVGTEFDTRGPDLWQDTAYDGGPPSLGFYVARVNEAEGILVVGFIPNLVEIGFELPPGNEEKLAFRIPVSISPEAEPGTLSLLPTNGPGGEGSGPASLRNASFRWSRASPSRCSPWARAIVSSVSPNGACTRLSRCLACPSWAVRRTPTWRASRSSRPTW